MLAYNHKIYPEQSSGLNAAPCPIGPEPVTSPEESQSEENVERRGVHIGEKESNQ